MSSSDERRHEGLRSDETRGEGTRREESREPREDADRLTTADLAGGDEAGAAERERDVEGDDGARQPLVEAADAERFRSDWSRIQAGFVDEPRRAVADADALVAQLMQQLAETFASERTELERQWDGDGDVSTEDLRLALQRYRSFFDRLLSA